MALDTADNAMGKSSSLSINMDILHKYAWLVGNKTVQALRLRISGSDVCLSL